MQNIPFFHSYNNATKHLSLRGASYVPEEILSYQDQIEILDLNKGSLTDLPQWISKLSQLKVLFCSENPFAKVPSVLKNCKKLEIIGFKSCQLSECPEDIFPASLKWLILSDNQLTKLPNSMGELINLQKVSLTGNQLSTLPDTMSNCREIEFLRLSANNFIDEPPAWIFQLPKLAWYGDNGNPFSEKFKLKELQIPDIHYQDLEITELLGQSPSSEVFKAKNKKSGETVAVKLFRNRLTSDGYPFDDKYAAMSAGHHKNLIKIHGKLIGVPENRKGLALELIPPTYSSLGLPPTLNSFSRDTYPKGLKLSIEQVYCILTDIKQACCHLHKQGLAHGDLYAHNILTNQQGHSFLGDFGAASFYDPKKSSPREKVDVRAFGILISELLERCDTNTNDKLVHKLTLLQQNCVQSDVAARPLFCELL